MKDILTPAGLRQILRFGLSGAVTAAADYGSFTVLFALGVPLIIASATSLLIGFTVSFSLNKIWVFGADGDKASKQTSKQLWLYAGLFIFNVFITYLFIAWVQALGVSAYLGKLMIMVVITIWNFVIYKSFIFALNKQD